MNRAVNEIADSFHESFTYYMFLYTSHQSICNYRNQILLLHLCWLKPNHVADQTLLFCFHEQSTNLIVKNWVSYLHVPV